MIATIINHLWQSTIFAAVVALLVLGLRKNRAHVRFWLWFGASAKFLVPFSLLMTLGSYWSWTPAAKTIATPAVSVAIVQIAQPFQDALQQAPEPVTHDWIPFTLFGIWGIGFLAIVSSRFRSWLRIQSVLRSSTAIEILAPVEVRTAPGLLDPGVVGILQPIVLLPADITQHLTPLQLHAILVHEFCHVRRRDNLLAAIHMLVEALFWFHPLVWWIGAKLLDERERACDEEVLRLGNKPQIYAESILKVCKRYVESPLICVSGVTTGSNLKKRIEAIMTNRTLLQLSFTKKAALACAGLTVLTIPVFIGSIRAQSSTPKFETVSVVHCPDEPGLRWGSGYAVSSGKLNTGCLPLADPQSLGLVQRAYVRFANGRAHPLGIVPIQGGPDWIRSETYRIEAQSSSVPNPETMQGPMLQAVLEDRFKLKLRRETRNVPVYALTVAPGGPRLKPFEEGSCIQMPITAAPPALSAGQKYCKVMVGIQPSGVHAQGSTLTELSQLLSLVLDRPAIDKTGILGKFDIHMEFAVDNTNPPKSDIASVLAALHQLGLKLEPANGPREFLVIDHVERPNLIDR